MGEVFRAANARACVRPKPLLHTVQIALRPQARIVEELLQREVQRAGDFVEALDREVPFATLDPPDIGPVYASEDCELFLGRL
jgi:hypothetical protein